MGRKSQKNKDGIDSIIGFPGISNSKLFFSRINELTPDSISPPNTGIEHKLIYDKKSDLGFVASIIPSSDIGPHMAKFGDNRYYQRIGHTSTLMEHYQISDLFGRRAIPSINISFIANPTSPLLSVLIENKGKGVAIAPYVLFSNVNSPYEVSPYPLTGNVNDFPLARTKKSSRYGQDGFVGGTSDLIHPGLNFKFRALQLPNTYNGSHPNEPLTASFTFGSIGSVVNTGKLIFDFSKKEFQLLDGASFIGVQSE